MIPKQSPIWRPIVLVLIAAAAIVWAHLIVRARGVELFEDARAYYFFGRSVAQTGLFGIGDPSTMAPEYLNHFKMRAYGYPFFVSICSVLSTKKPDKLAWVVFEAQLAIHLLVSLFFARTVARLLGPRAIVYLAFALTALNPWLLIRTTEFLSDSLSASLVLLAFCCLLRSVGANGSAWVWWPVLAFFTLGFAVMVRPANMLAAPVVSLVWLLASPGPWLPRLMLAPALLAAFAAPFVPQAVNNKRMGGTYNPLPLASKHVQQEVTLMGMICVKYETVVWRPGCVGIRLRDNPLYDPDLREAGKYLRKKPLAYAGICLMHAYFLFDQDAPFTYVLSPKVWYRWPSSAGGFAFLGLALFGVALAVRKALRPARQRFRFAVVAALAVAGGLLLVLMPAQVECRYAAGLFAILSLFVVYACHHLWRLVRFGFWGQASLVTATLLIFVAASCWASYSLEPFTRNLGC
jgi:hypothetical protein